jgi:hypothetical protein
MEVDEHRPPALRPGTAGSEHADAAHAEVVILQPSDRERSRRTRSCRHVADGRVPRQLVHLWKIDQVLVVKGNILGIES